MNEDLFRALLIIQPFFWMWVLEENRFKFLNREHSGKIFAIIVGLFIASVFITGIRIGNYTNNLLMLYPAFVLWVFRRCRREFKCSFRESMALAFLIVYLNSWFWEGVLHLWAIVENGFNMNQAYQMLHLIPALYFLIRWEFDANSTGNELMKGWALSGVISFSRMGKIWQRIPMLNTVWIHIIFNHGLMTLNRIICLWFLTNAIMAWGMPKDCRNFFKQ